MNRPDWVLCIRNQHADREGISWCGREVGYYNVFRDVNHAICNGLVNGYRVACPECVNAALRVLQNGASDIGCFDRVQVGSSKEPGVLRRPVARDPEECVRDLYRTVDSE